MTLYGQLSFEVENIRSSINNGSATKLFGIQWVLCSIELPDRIIDDVDNLNSKFII